MESKDKTSKIFLFMTSKHIIQLCNFSPALVLTLPPPPCYIHFPFLLQQLRDRKLYLISTWVKTLLNSWAFWHKSQTSASPKVKLKYDREKKRRGWSKEPSGLHGKCKSLQQSCQKKLSLVCFTTLVFAHHKVSRQIGSSPGQQASQSAVPSSLMGKRRGNEWPFATQALLFPWS